MGTKGVAELLEQGYEDAPMDHRKELCSSIFISGGNFNFRGLGPRLEKDIKKLFQKKVGEDFLKKMFKVTSPGRTDNQEFKGACIFAELASESPEETAGLCITKADWKAHGESIV